MQRPDAEIAFDVVGEGEPVLLIQGVGMAGCAWSPQVRAAADRHRLCVFDHRGIGRSTGRPESIEQMVGDVLALLDTLGWETAHVAGHSMGGVVAQAVALEARHRVRSLGLLCTVARGRRILPLTPAAVWRQMRCQLGTREMRRRAFYRLVAARRSWRDASAGIEELERVFGRNLADLPSAARRQVIALARYDASRRLTQLRGVASLVVVGAEDRVCPPDEGCRLARLLDGGLLELHGGHAVVVQEADAVNRALLELWSRADAAN